MKLFFRPEFKISNLKPDIRFNIKKLLCACSMCGFKCIKKVESLFHCSPDVSVTSLSDIADKIPFFLCKYFNNYV